MEVSIRSWRIEDAERIAIALNNPNVQNNLRDGIPLPYTVRDAESFIRSTLDAEPDSQYHFAIVVDGEAVGSIGISRKVNVHRLTAEMGYYLAEPHWGRGIVTQAVKSACGYIFANTDIVRIFAEPYAYNSASCRVLTKAGFTLEGILRKNAIKNGEVLDMMLYSILKEEYGA